MIFDPRQKIYLICETGALGDTIATFPILKILTDRGHIEKMFVDDRFLDLYLSLFPKDVVVRLKDAMTRIPKAQVTPDIPQHVIDPRTGDACFLNYPLLPNIPVVNSMSPYWLSSIHAHLIDSASAAIANCILKESEKDYPQIDKLPDNHVQSINYVVVSYGSTTEHRKMLPEVFQSIKDHLKNIDIVLLGKSDHQLECCGKLVTPNFDALDRDGCIDMIDKTTILESLRIIKDAKAIIGVDGGLLHLAGMTDTPIVAGYTTVEPYYRMPYRHGVKGWKVYPVEPDSECRYCQTRTFETFEIQFNRCSTMTRECMYSLTADKWISKIEEALS